MSNIFLDKTLFITFFYLFSFSFIYSQSTKEDSSIYYCTFGNIEIKNIDINELNDTILNDIILLNLNNLKNNVLLMHFNEEYQLFLFRISNCTNQLLYDEELLNYLNNKLHLFSIEGKIESDPSIIKLVIQTKKEFKIFYYNNYTRINNFVNTDKYYKIKTNIFTFYRNKIFYDKEYQIFKNENINIFDYNDKFFNDICFKYESFNIYKTPELRKSLYYFKNDNLTYPLLDSDNNCLIDNNYISYENESIFLEYKCKINFNISAKDIRIKGISIIDKKELETYKGQNSLKDQREILKCPKESFRPNNIKNNVGLYISLFLILVVIICLSAFIILKYEIKYKEEKGNLENPPKKKSLKETLKERKEKKKAHLDNNEEIIEKEKRKKKKKKKKQIINSDNEEDSKENNIDLNLYSNNRVLIDENDNKDSKVEFEDFIEKEKKEKKKGKKKKKGRKSNKTKLEDYQKRNSYDDKIDHESDFTFKNEENDNKYKTISKFPSTYKTFQINAANKLKEKLNIRRLVIITNLGKNYQKTRIFDIEDKFRNEPKKEKGLSIKINNDSKNDNTMSLNNNLIPSEKDNDRKEEENKNEKIENIIGLEVENSFIGNIMRDYLNFKEAILYDKRTKWNMFVHFMKLKNDLINIFLLNYSFIPYSIRMIKFTFFFHFIFYLETLCIGQKYYFDKYYSKEFQDFLTKNNFYGDNSLLNNSTYNNNNYLNKYFSTKTIEFTKIHFLYTFKYSFPRVLIPFAISLISYFITSLLSPRRKIIKILLNGAYKQDIKYFKMKLVIKRYRIIYLVFGILAFLLMLFFFYSTINYFFVFEDAKYDIPQSFILSGLMRFIFDIILWLILALLRVYSINMYEENLYKIINKIYEIN